MNVPRKSSTSFEKKQHRNVWNNRMQNIDDRCALVILFPKLIPMFLRYFDPTPCIFDDKNK